MAFMMPVVKNDWDIYKTGRSRRSSECSNPQSCPRSRKVSECSKSEGPSLSTSPGSDFVVGVASPGHHRSSVPVAMSSMSRQFSSRASSRASLQSPCKSASCSPPKAASLHTGGGGHHGGGNHHQSSAPAASASASQSSLNKFHLRLVDKLKRSVMRKESTVTPPPAGAVAAS